MTCILSIITNKERISVPTVPENPDYEIDPEESRCAYLLLILGYRERHLVRCKEKPLHNAPKYRTISIVEACYATVQTFPKA